ncbi:MAG: GDP-L-fucose synthase [Desulfobacterales bacterium]|nr:GDP-L-fucose synthase [Desulfobacterales bacterium]MDD4072294.1 GDP-L-fucose synthase [Desulfobacterales bacterium]MDD4392705.1 GDP-L-fucose synthase [Desulfobacterales bacterium]
MTNNHKPQACSTASSPQCSALSPQHSIFVAGHRGMVGSAVVRCLRAKGFANIITRTHDELDLTSQQAVREFFQNEKIDQVVLAAAKVGGIHANNTYPARFIYENLMIETHVIHEAYRAGVKRLLFLGSSCIYPKLAPQPMAEDSLLTGYLEPSNEPYAIAKIAGIKLCESYNRQYGTKYRSVMPTNLYGPNDNYNLENSHVLPAMIRKFHLAKLALEGDLEAIQKDEAVYGPIPDDIRKSLQSGVESQESRAESRQSCPSTSGLRPLTSDISVRLWGTGTPRREFLHADDLASACVFVMSLEDRVYERFTSPMMSHINVGTGQDITIAELSDMIRDIVGFRGEIIWDSSKPDGTPRKLLDVSRLKHLGWSSHIAVYDGIKQTYHSYLQRLS